MSRTKIKEKRIDVIRRLCSENNLSLSEVFRKADIPYSTVQNWDNKEPEAFTTYDTLIDTIDEIVLQKTVEGNNVDA